MAAAGVGCAIISLGKLAACQRITCTWIVSQRMRAAPSSQARDSGGMIIVRDCHSDLHNGYRDDRPVDFLKMLQLALENTGGLSVSNRPHMGPLTPGDEDSEAAVVVVGT
jgi:hypothetical protein